MSSELVKREVERIFGDRNAPVEIDPEMTLLSAGTVPDEIVTLVTSFEEDEYVDGSFREWDHQLLYGAWGFEETNGEDGMISDMIAQGSLSEGTLEIGEHLLVDTRGDFPLAIKGAVYAVSSDYILEEEGRDRVADSVLELLKLIKPIGEQKDLDPLHDAPASSPPDAESEPVHASPWTPTTTQYCTVGDVTITVDVPVAFVVEQDATGFRALSSAGDESVGVTFLPETSDVEFELKMGGAFEKDTHIERDELGGKVTIPGATTRVMLAGTGLVRCYVRGGSSEERHVVCTSLRVVLS